jgi:hypothetical protein
MISIILFILAAFFNALMDATENAPNFNESRLKTLPKTFWLKEVSWKYAARLFNYKLDAWHIAKSCMVICFVLTAIFFDWPVEKWQDVAIYLIAGGVIWNATFYFFYHVLFKVK